MKTAGWFSVEFQYDLKTMNNVVLAIQFLPMVGLGKELVFEIRPAWNCR